MNRESDTHQEILREDPPCHLRDWEECLCVTIERDLVGLVLTQCRARNHARLWCLLFRFQLLFAVTVSIAHLHSHTAQVVGAWVLSSC